MIDFRNDFNEEELELKAKMNVIQNKMDALALIKTLKFRRDEVKKHSFTIDILCNTDVFYRLFGIVDGFVSDERSAWIFEGPSQNNNIISFLVGENRVLQLALIQIYDYDGKNETNLLYSKITEPSKEDKTDVLTDINDLDRIINEIAKQFNVDKYSYKGRQRNRNKE